MFACTHSKRIRFENYYQRQDTSILEIICEFVFPNVEIRIFKLRSSFFLSFFNVVERSLIFWDRLVPQKPNLKKKTSKMLLPWGTSLGVGGEIKGDFGSILLGKRFLRFSKNGQFMQMDYAVGKT